MWNIQFENVMNSIAHEFVCDGDARIFARETFDEATIKKKKRLLFFLVLFLSLFYIHKTEKKKSFSLLFLIGKYFKSTSYALSFPCYTEDFAYRSACKCFARCLHVLYFVIPWYCYLLIISRWQNVIFWIAGICFKNVYTWLIPCIIPCVRRYFCGGLL